MAPEGTKAEKRRVTYAGGSGTTAQTSCPLCRKTTGKRGAVTFGIGGMDKRTVVTFLSAAWGMCAGEAGLGRLVAQRWVLPLLVPPAARQALLAAPLLVRAFLGYSLLFALRLVIRAATTPLAPRLLGALPRRLRTLWQPPVPQGGCAPGTWGRPGVAKLRPDGYPYDAYALRTVITYSLVVFTVSVYREILGVECKA